MSNLRHQRSILQLSFLMLLLNVSSLAAQTNFIDVLAYTVNSGSIEDKADLMLYEPLSRSRSLLRSSVEHGHFKLSKNGQLAFSSTKDGNTDIYVTDTQQRDEISINITQASDAYDYPLGWSLDGKYLAFASRTVGDKSIYIWDGEKTTNITPPNTNPVSRYFSDDIAWNTKNELAFTIWQPTKADSSEIYFWNGRETIDISQTPFGGDSSPVWNTNGQLAFSSLRNGKYDIFVWDGLSFKDNQADTDSFINIAPELTDYMSFPNWTNKGLLAFNTTGAYDSHVQVYVWNGQTAYNISLNPDLHNGFPTWSTDGRWAFSTFWSSKQLVYVKDVNNQTIFTANAEYPPAWSSDGNLAFCTRGSKGWELSVWDGKTISKVTEGGDISAQWSSGSSISCSSG